MFKDTVGLTIQTYVQRRRLTEAAKPLAFSRKPILEIALLAGYESQQAFTDVYYYLWGSLWLWSFFGRPFFKGGDAGL